MRSKGGSLMSKTERLEAKGLRGEACIILRTWTRLDTSNLSGESDVGGPPSHRLATGERLNPTDDPAVFETQDGVRRFTLG